MSTTETEKFEPVCDSCGDPALFVVTVDPRSVADEYDTCGRCVPRPSAHVSVRCIDDGRRR